MLTYSLVDYAKFRVECELLRQMHYLEVLAPRGYGYNMHHDAYESYEENLRIIVAYDEELVPVGYHVAAVTEVPHDQDMLVALTDLVFMHPDHRKGRAGLELMKVAEADLVAFCPGVPWRAACPIDGDRDIGVVLERGMGMRPVERVYEKTLAGDK